MPSVEPKSPTYETLSDGDLTVTAAQLYHLYLNHPNNQTANVFYKSCAFEIDFVKGNVTQQFVKTGAVNSIVKSVTANDFAEQLKQAHSQAAMIAILEEVKTIKDNKLQTELANITAKNPAMTAGQVLNKLSSNQQTNLTSFSLFNQAGAQSISPALATVRKVLANLGSLTTLSAASDACKQLAENLQAVTHPELKR